MKSVARETGENGRADTRRCLSSESALMDDSKLHLWPHQLLEMTFKGEMTSSLSHVNFWISSKYDHFLCLLVIFYFFLCELYSLLFPHFSVRISPTFNFFSLFFVSFPFSCILRLPLACSVADNGFEPLAPGFHLQQAVITGISHHNWLQMFLGCPSEYYHSKSKNCFVFVSTFSFLTLFHPIHVKQNRTP